MELWGCVETQAPRGGRVARDPRGLSVGKVSVEIPVQTDVTAETDLEVKMERRV